MELPLQPYKIQLYTFRVQGLAFFLPWFPDYYAMYQCIFLLIFRLNISSRYWIDEAKGISTADIHLNINISTE